MSDHVNLSYSVAKFLIDRCIYALKRRTFSLLQNNLELFICIVIIITIAI